MKQKGLILFLATLFFLLSIHTFAKIIQTHKNDINTDTKKVDKETIKINISSGSPSGTYYKMAKSLGKLPNVSVNILTSKGSVENIENLLHSRAQFGIVQMDVFMKRYRDDPKVAQELSLFVPLYKEEIQILGKKSILNIADLKGRKISIGEKGSGMHVSSQIILAEANVTKENSIFLEYSKVESLQKLMYGELDALVFVSSAPMEILSYLSSSANKVIKLILPQESLVGRLSKGDFKYSSSFILPNTYKWASVHNRVLTVESAIIVRRNFAPKFATLLFEKINEFSGLLYNQHRRWKEYSMDKMDKYYKENAKLYHPAIALVLSKVFKESTL